MGHHDEGEKDRLSVLHQGSEGATPALVYVYVAEHIRNPGVLVQDCRVHEGELIDLEELGLVERASWYRHSIYHVSAKGRAAASAELVRRVGSNTAQLKKGLDYIPKRITKFLIDWSLLKLRIDELSYPINLQELSPYADIPNDTFNCIITRGLTNALSEILYGFERLGCAVRATYYVSTRGGETREQRIVVSEEAVKFLKTYSSDLDEEELPTRLRHGHTLYHGLHDFRLRRDWFLKDEKLMKVRAETWHERTSFLTRLGLLEDSKEELVARDREGLERLLEQLYLDPILQYLEERRPQPAEDTQGDPNTRTDAIGVRLGQILDNAMKQQDEAWLTHLVDRNVLRKASDRMSRKVPEDSRAYVYQFLTLGELKDLLNKKPIWNAVSRKFVNSAGDDPDPSKFQSSELFFGCLDLVIAYRNPPSHGFYLRPDETNMMLIDATLSKLKRILAPSST